MIDLQLYRMRVGTFGGGRHTRRKRLKMADLSLTRGDVGLLLIFLLGVVMVVGVCCPGGGQCILSQFMSHGAGGTGSPDGARIPGIVGNSLTCAEGGVWPLGGVNMKGDGGCPVFWGGCLLYTSPSPRDLSTSRMPSSA